MSDTWVSADPTAKEQAARLNTFVNGDLPAALKTLNQLAAALEQNPKFHGTQAAEYRQSVYPSITNSSNKMAQDLQQMSQALGKVITGILAAGGM